MTTSTANCARCGTPIAPGTRFCPKCGSDVSGEQGNVATAYVPKADMARATMGADALLEAVRHATLGDYEILGELGRGGMATVYLAHDAALDRKVAIKVMSPALLTGDGMIERFKREARTAGNLSHPHIIPIYAVQEGEHLVYFVMKFVEGRPLDSIIKEVGPLPIPMVQTILQQVGSALAYAHRRGVVHRDIKPANIMIDSEGWAVVTDFGIAKVSEKQGLTMTGATVGTPSYMSPEQCAAKDITGSSDQYSFGIVAFEMLTGRLPFVADSIMAIMYQHFNEPPPSIKEFRADVPPEIEATVLRMLAKDPAERWPDVDAAIAGLGATPLKHDDPIRTKMMTLAATGINAQMTQRFSTPRSPMPAPRTPKPGTKTGFKTAAASAAQQTGFTLSPRQVTVAVGGAVQLTASQRKTGGGTLAGEEISWASTDGHIATVSETGLVTAIAPGTAVITATCGTVSATGSVVVTPLEKKKTGGAFKIAGGVVAVSAVAAVAWVLGPWNKPPANQLGNGSQVPAESAATSTGQPVLQPRADSAPPVAVAPPATPTPRRPTSTARNTGRVNDSLLAAVRGEATRARNQAVAAGAGAADLSSADAQRDAAERLVRSGRISDALTGYSRAIAQWTAAEQTARDRTTALSQPVAPARPDPTPPVAPPAAAPVDPRPQVEAAIAAYVRAIESRDLAQVKSVYSNLTPRQEQGWRDFFQNTQNLKVSYRISGTPRIGDANALVSVAATYDFLPKGTRTRQQQPVQFEATLERSGATWRIVTIQ